ncbi:hypothetical protein [Rheinheimera pacifica]|uniref:hypothetical protein n=1 Tax=Rheinheimera pacifica TaxID=173990 RepID=UPI002ED7FD43
MRIFFLQLLLLCATSLHSEQTEHQHNYIGSHGMVLFNAGDTLLASHLPLYRPPHDYQLVYQLALPAAAQQALLTSLRSGQQLTLLPQDFDLRQMIEGKVFHLSAAVYQGHFERSGRLLLDNVQVTFARQLYSRPLQQLTVAFAAHYDAINIADSHFLLHRIAAAPSFDQILQLEQPLAAPLILPATDAATALQQLSTKGIHARQLYLETADFQ